MDSSITLKSIAVGQQNCKVFGRLIRLWDAINMNPRSLDPLISIDGVLLDEDGTKAQISVPKNIEKQFRPLLAQGSAYIISNVSAIDSKKKSYIYHHQDYMLQFKHNTMVHRLESRGSDIPKFSFDFCPFDQLPDKDIPSKPLLDIIGVISDVGPYDFASPTSQKKLRKIKIRNLDEQTEKLLLWGQHGESFDEEAVLKKSQAGIVVGIFAGMPRGSSSSATEVYLDLDISEVAKYRTSYQWECPTLQHLHSKQQANCIPLTKYLLCQHQLFREELIVPSVKWYYKACKRCQKGYNKLTDSQTCVCPVSIPWPIYKLPLTLTDSSGSLEAIAFSYVAEELVERDGDQASQSMKIDAADHVVALDNAIGKTKLFYIGSTTLCPVDEISPAAARVDAIFSQEFWFNFCHENRIDDIVPMPHETVRSWWLLLADRYSRNKRHEIAAVSIAGTRRIWLERNARTFERQSMNLNQLVKLAQEEPVEVEMDVDGTAVCNTL